MDFKNHTLCNIKENWHWDEKCQYCTVVCKEKQNFQHECNSTHNRLCKCIEGYHLEIEFCIKHSSCRSGYGVKKLGTSEDDTVCERCPGGYYSNELSATKPCIKHTNCAELGLRTSSPGTATRDAVCDTNEKGSSSQCFHNQLECYTDITLCEEAVFQFIASQGLPAYQLDMLMDSLPGQKVDGRNIEMVKKMCNPKQQTIHLLKLWMHQNKDQDKIYSIYQDMNQCERVVSRCPGFKNLTLDHFNIVKESLPGNKVKEEDIRWIVKTCDPKQYIPQLLSLWKAQNADQDTANVLSQSVKKLRSQKVPKKLLQSLRRIVKIFNNSAIHRIYQKMFLEIIQGSTVAIVTSDGRMIVGTLKGFDQTINLILDESHERVFSSTQGVEQVVLGLYIVRGDNVAVIGEIDEETDSALDLGNIRAEPLNSVVH
ncbi:UNVERIFIED_CONTAM: hypothetical protein FKN15_017460 [Acipenser sinensis]